MNNNVRRITDGAMMTAIVGALLLINRQFAGLFEESFLFLFPLPMVFYSAKYGMKSSWIVLVAILLLTIVIGTPQTLFYVASESLIGMIYGGGIYKGTDSRKLVVITMVISVFASVISMIIYAQFFGYNIVEEVGRWKNILIQAAASQGIVIPDSINLNQYVMTVLIVATILTGILQAFITHVLARTLLKRFHYHVEPATPFFKYFPPVWSGYLAFFGTCVYFYLATRPLENELLQNTLMVIGMCGAVYLTIYGMIAILVYTSVRMPKIKILALLLSFFLVIGMPMLMITIGFLYITTSWHKRLLEGDAHATRIE
ncbi:MAG: DUF2232 domain-containing protein [Solobacterium sp.]|nr:DUF2232 domain-containing protein [Solobacterium sp.]